EKAYEFVKDTANQAGVHHSERYVPYFGTVFLFILVMNVIGLIPAFESPTMSPWVPAGLAVCTFIYYNAFGIQAQGLGKYLGHLAGPVTWLAPLMIVIELISHFARPLSLTVRLYGNIFGGEQVTNVFLGMTYSRLIVPVIFMGLHLFFALIQT